MLGRLRLFGAGATSTVLTSLFCVSEIRDILRFRRPETIFRRGLRCRKAVVPFSASYPSDVLCGGASRGRLRKLRRGRVWYRFKVFNFYGLLALPISLGSTLGAPRGQGG